MMPKTLGTASLPGMSPINLAHLRRVLAGRGLTPASAVPDASGDRTEESCIREARLLEGTALDWIPVGPAEPWPDPLAFLDGVQRSELLAYAGASVIVAGEIAAAVRERRDRGLTTVVEERRLLAIGRPGALEAAGDALSGFQQVALPEDEPPHPIRDQANGARALDRARGGLELSLGDRYRARSDGWLVVDGSLTESPLWSADPRMLGDAKSHATLQFDGADLES